MPRWGALFVLMLACSASAAANELVPLGPEFIATSRISNDQKDVWVGSDDDGNFVVSYAQGDIFRRRFDRDGTPLEDDVQVNTTITYNNQDETYLAVNPKTGDFVVCYSDREAAANDGFLMGAGARFFQADGTPRGDEFFLNTQRMDSQFEPHAVFSVGGRVMTAWTDAFVDGSAGVIGRVFSKEGTPLTGEFLINAPNSATQIDPSLSCSRDGLFVCAWVDASGATGEPREVMYRLMGPNGNFLTGQLLANSASGGMQRDPIVAMDADGDFVIVWQDESDTDGGGGATPYGIYARLFHPDGSPKGPQFLVPQSTAGTQRDPHVSIDFTGNFVVTWESDHSGDFDVLIRRYDRFGNPLSDETVAHQDTSGQQTHGKSCLSQSGERLVTVWHHDPVGTVNQGNAVARIFAAETVTVTGVAELTGTVDIDLDIPGQGGSLYFILPSLATSPTISVNGERTLRLAVDDLLRLAFPAPAPGLFSNIFGTLDPSGQAHATFTVPNLPSFYDTPVYVAALTSAPGNPISFDLNGAVIDNALFLSRTHNVDVAGPRRFHPKQIVRGEIDSATDEDRAAFEGLKGEKLKIVIATVDPPEQSNALPEIIVEVLDADEVPIKRWKRRPPPAKKKKRKINWKVPADGTYFLRITGSAGAMGHYKMVTNHKLKKKAKPTRKTVKVGNAGLARIKFIAKEGTELSLAVKPKGSAPMPTTVDLAVPGGGVIDLLPFLTLNGTKLVASGIPLPGTGKYTLMVTAPKKKKYKISLSPLVEFVDPDVTIE